MMKIFCETTFRILLFMKTVFRRKKTLSENFLQIYNYEPHEHPGYLMLYCTAMAYCFSFLCIKPSLCPKVYMSAVYESYLN